MRRDGLAPRVDPGAFGVGEHQTFHRLPADIRGMGLDVHAEFQVAPDRDDDLIARMGDAERQSRIVDEAGASEAIVLDPQR